MTPNNASQPKAFTLPRPGPTPPSLPRPDSPGEASPRSPLSPTPQSRKTNPANEENSLTPQASSNNTAPTPPNPRKTSLQTLVSLGGVRPPKPKPTTGTPNALARDTLKKYINVEMPEIHMANPSALFDLVESPLLKEWDNYPEGKLAIIPFGIEIHSQLQVRNLRNLIFTAVAEITQAERLGLSAPRPNEKANSISRHPMTFLAYNLTENQCKILQERSVWASPELTFQVAPIEPCRPNYLFTLADFTTMDADEIHRMVLGIWKDDESQEFFTSLTQAMEMDDQTTGEPPLTLPEIQAVVNSMRISVIKLMIHVPIDPENPSATKPILKPRFNIYVDSKHIRDFQIWTQIRNFLADRSYYTPTLDQGRTIIAPHNCGICHGVDHPRGLCSFPSLPGWKGPKCQTDKRGRLDSDRPHQFQKNKKPRFNLD